MDPSNCWAGISVYLDTGCHYILTVISLKLKQRHAVKNCGLAAGHISAGHEVLFGSQLTLKPGTSHTKTATSSTRISQYQVGH